MVLFALKHPKAIPVILKIGKSITLKSDGYFTYSSGKAFDPADTVIIDNIRADHTFKDVVEEKTPEGRFKRLSGYVGGYADSDAS